MAITKMNKFTLVCFRKDKKSVLKNLQKFGNSQFINLQAETNDGENPLNFMNSENVDDEIKSVDNYLAMIRSSLSFLSKYSVKPSGFKVMKEGKESLEYCELKSIVKSSNWDDICRELKSKETRLNEINNEINKLNGDISALLPWSSLDVSVNKLLDLKEMKAYTGVVSVANDAVIKELKDEFATLGLCKLYSVNKVNNELYIVVFVHKSQVAEAESLLKKFDYTEVKINAFGEVESEISALTEKVNALKNEFDKISNDLQSDTRLGLLEKCEEYYANYRERIESSKNFVGSKNTIVLSGWVPFELNNELEEAIKVSTEGNFILSFEEVSEEEDLEVPVKLKNNGFVGAFESITEMYSLPNYKGIDPTPWLAPFYLVFFGMMVADFGYGLLVTIAALLALKVFNLEEESRKFAKLFAYLGLSTTAWGLVYGAGFGDTITFKSILDLQNDTFTVMYMSIGFGVFQILMGLSIKAATLIKMKKYYTAFAEVGLWFITFAGIAATVLKVPFGVWIMVGGMVGIVCTNGGDAKSIGGKLGNGAYALYGIANYVGDLISYTRLMALGVAGGSIAGAMNLIISYIPAKGALLIVIPVLFVLLHIFNLLLGLLGAYVHSCRLQYVEYFGKFYEGGGESFKPLKMINKHIKVK